MRIVGYPTEWDEAEGLQPIDIQDVQIYATIEELNQLYAFLKESLQRREEGKSQTLSIELPDSKANPQTGINIMFLINDKLKPSNELMHRTRKKGRLVSRARPRSRR